MNGKKNQGPGNAAGPPDRTTAGKDRMDEAAAHHRAGRHSEAERLYRDILDAEPFNALVHGSLGSVLLGQDRIEDAVRSFSRALDLDHENAPLLANLGTALLEQGRLGEAERGFELALAIDPGLAMAHANLGTVLEEQGRLEDAVGSYRRALELDPDNALTHGNLGTALQKQGLPEDAMASFARALDIDPANALGHSNMGTALLHQGRLDEAMAQFERGLGIDPESAVLRTNLGAALLKLGRMDDAMAAHRRALVIDPDFAEAHLNYSHALLLAGRFAEGWAEYEWRLRCHDYAAPRWTFGRPRWDGEGLEGGTVLLYADQGLGDVIQSIRYVPMAAARAGRVAVKGPARLQRLLRPVAMIDDWLDEGGLDEGGADGDDQTPRFDAYAPLLSLPYIFETEIGTIPAEVPYLAAEDDRIGPWRDRLGGGFKVGIAWQGSPAYEDDRERSVPLGRFQPLSKIPGVRLISLQKLDGLGQLADLPPGMAVETLGDGFDAGPDAFIDAAAVMMSLDLVVTSDTSIAHLAGALGRPVWVALKFMPDWRWLLGREDTPWYPTMRLFRQPSPGDWGGVFAAMDRALRKLAGG